MARSAAKCRQDAVGHLHAADVLGAGLPADENHASLRVALGVLVHPRLRVLGVKLDTSGRGSGAGVDALRKELVLRNGLTFRLGIEDRLQELIQVVRRNPRHREGFVPGDEPLMNHVHGDPHGGKPGPLAVARLQHPELYLFAP